MTILTNFNQSVRAVSGRSPAWQAEMKGAIRDLPALLQALRLPADLAQNIGAAVDFPVFVPQAFLSRIEPGNPSDPLLLQVLPRREENRASRGFTVDPLDESASTLSPGLLQKYQGRVLFVATGACAIHCRYCFRRHFPYQDSPVSIQQWEPAIEQIESDPTIHEALISGGDPLTLVDAKIEQLVHRLEQIPHLKRLRIHTRLPIVIPSRVTNRLIDCLVASRLNSYLVVHANHPNEISTEVQQQLRRFQQTPVTLLNQSVLLRGVNDRATDLIELSERLLDCGVLPYYLHQLDPVTGTGHFHVPVERGQELIRQMRATLPGFAVPRYVQELAGEPNKTVLA